MVVVGGGLARPVCIDALVCVCWLSVVCCLFCVFAFVTVAENKCETNWLNMSEWVKDVKGPL